MDKLVETVKGIVTSVGMAILNNQKLPPEKIATQVVDPEIERIIGQKDEAFQKLFQKIVKAVDIEFQKEPTYHKIFAMMIAATDDGKIPSKFVATLALPFIEDLYKYLQENHPEAIEEIIKS